MRYLYVHIGEADIIDSLSDEQIKQLDFALRKSGLLVMDNAKSIIVEKIKNAIIEVVHHTDGQIKTNLSDYLSDNRITSYNVCYTKLLRDFFHNNAFCIVHNKQP